MILYHGSNIGGIRRLKPMKADHDRPYVYLTVLETVAAMYLCNTVERPYYWFPYGFDNCGDIPVYHELYPDALREVSEGVKGYIYVVETSDDRCIPFPDNPYARLGTTEINVIRVIEVPDAYDLIQRYISDGRMMVSSFEEKSPQQLEQWYSMVADYMNKKNMIKDPECSYARFVKEKIPNAWKIYLNKINDRV